jgi:hypothetical protein
MFYDNAGSSEMLWAVFWLLDSTSAGDVPCLAINLPFPGVWIEQFCYTFMSDEGDRRREACG